MPSGQTVQRPHAFLRRFTIDVREDQHEFVAAHARDKVIVAATVLKRVGDNLQQLVARQVAQRIVHLFKAVQIAHEHGEP